MTLNNAKQLVSRLGIATLLLALIPLQVSAAQITARSVTLSSSSAAAANATTSYTIKFTVPTVGTSIKSFKADVCTTASGVCTTPAGFLNTTSTLASQPVNFGAGAGWTVSTGTAGSLRMLNAANVTNPSGAQTVVFGNVQNPTTTNQTFYLQLTTYSDSAWTTVIDTGSVATSTANQILLTASVPETLSFCVYTGANCGVGGNSVSLGTLSSAATNSGFSLMDVGTNASSGYVVTVNGLTLTSGANTIAAYAGAASVIGTSGFGINLRANTTPAVGTDVTVGAFPSIGTYGASYGTVNTFNFTTGDIVAQSAGPTNNNTFKVSYVANIGTAQAAGAYATTFTYICTATF